jgi:hypothetical protein
MEALILVATHGGPTMFARIGVVRGAQLPHRGERSIDLANIRLGGSGS